MNSINSAFNNGVMGFKKAQESIIESSDKIANANNANFKINKAEELVNLIKQENVAKANAKVIKTENDMIGTIIDIKA